MNITEVRIQLMPGTGKRGENKRLHAFASITFDDAFVVRDPKIIEGTQGLFVAMPSRKLTDRWFLRHKELPPEPLLYPLWHAAR